MDEAGRAPEVEHGEGGRRSLRRRQGKADSQAVPREPSKPKTVFCTRIAAIPVRPALPPI